MPPAYVAWRTGTSNRVVVPARQAGNRFLGSLIGLQIRALKLYRTARKNIYCIGYLYLCNKYHLLHDNTVGTYPLPVHAMFCTINVFTKRYLGGGLFGFLGSYGKGD